MRLSLKIHGVVLGLMLVAAVGFSTWVWLTQVDEPPHPPYHQLLITLSLAVLWTAFAILSTALVLWLKPRTFLFVVIYGVTGWCTFWVGFAAEDLVLEGLTLKLLGPDPCPPERHRPPEVLSPHESSVSPPRAATALVDVSTGKYRVGQQWKFESRHGEEGALLTIVKVESNPKLGVIVHISLTGLHLASPTAPGGFTDVIEHAPFGEAALDQSVTSLVGTSGHLPPFEDGYRRWRSDFEQGGGGVFTVPVSAAETVVEGTLKKQRSRSPDPAAPAALPPHRAPEPRSAEPRRSG